MTVSESQEVRAHLAFFWRMTVFSFRCLLLLFSIILAPIWIPIFGTIDQFLKVWDNDIKRLPNELLWQFLKAWYGKNLKLTREQYQDKYL